MSNSISISIAQGSEFKAIIQEDVLNKKDIFYKIYSDAFTRLNEIVLYSKSLNIDEYSTKELLNYPNNIISFISDRGNGKTTALLSFSNALDKINTEPKYKDNSLTKDIANDNFIVLDCINPTTMEKHDSLVLMVISRIFYIFEQNYKTELTKGTLDERAVERCRNIVELFQNCYKSLSARFEKQTINCEEDEIDNIMNLIDSDNAKVNILNLIQEIIKMFYSKNFENNFFVIQIDDADLNIEKSYSIIEEIKKYLILPNVIILVATNVKQLHYSVEQAFIEQFSTSLNHNGNVTNHDCYKISSSYITKLFPVSTQIAIPKINEYIIKNYEKLNLNYYNSSKKNLLPSYISTNYEDKALELLFKKTSIFLVTNVEYLHNLVPSTMRELTNFLSYFTKLEDIKLNFNQDNISLDLNNKKIKSELIKFRNNLQALEDYLVEHWSSFNLRFRGRNFLNELRSIPRTAKYKSIINYIPKYYVQENSEFYNDYFDFENEWIKEEKLKNPFIKTYTFEDVEKTLNILLSLQNRENQHRFIYSIRLYLTIYNYKKIVEDYLKTENIKEVKNNFVENLGDVSFSYHERNVLSYNRFYLNKNHLQTALNNIKIYFDKNKIKSPYVLATLKWFCRENSNATHYVKNIQIDSNSFYIQSKGELVFDSAYYLLYLLKNDESDNKNTLTTDKLRALQTCINWDIRYQSLRYIRDNKPPREETLLYKSIDKTYKLYNNAFKNKYSSEFWDNYCCSLFKEIYPYKLDTTDIEAYKISDEQFMINLTLIAIQMSDPKLAQELLSYLEKIINDFILNYNNSFVPSNIYILNNPIQLKELFDVFRFLSIIYIDEIDSRYVNILNKWENLIDNDGRVFKGIQSFEIFVCIINDVKDFLNTFNYNINIDIEEFNFACDSDSTLDLNKNTTDDE